MEHGRKKELRLLLTSIENTKIPHSHNIDSHCSSSWWVYRYQFFSFQFVHTVAPSRLRSAIVSGRRSFTLIPLGTFYRYQVRHKASCSFVSKLPCQREICEFLFAAISHFAPLNRISKALRELPPCPVEKKNSSLKSSN